MVSVTQRVAQVKQPRGGYVHPSLLRTQYVRGDRPMLIDHQGENVHSSLVGMAVDYLTRLAIGADPREAFRVSLRGARWISAEAVAQADMDVDSLTPGRVDAAAIAAACRLSSFDVAARNNPVLYRPDAQTTPDETTTAHIGAMVGRTVSFFESQGGVLLAGFTFLGGYTELIDSGDGDYLTPGVLWDLKVSVAPPKNAQTLQLLVYYLLGQHAFHDDLAVAREMGFFNPRLNAAFRLRADAIPLETIAAVSRDVIGYPERKRRTRG